MATWLVTGCSSGLGREIAREALERGHRVVVTARDVSRVRDFEESFPHTALAVALDVGDRDRITAVASAAEERFGPVDVLVNNAGHGYRAAIEEADEDEVAELFATNFSGPIALIKAVLPAMRTRRSGAIVNVSSIGAPRSNAGSGYYSATKAALEAASDGLRREVGPLGITVLVVEPGAFRTDFSGRSLLQSASAVEAYADTAGRRRKENDTTHGTQPGDPVRAPAAIIAAIDDPHPPFRLLLGSDAVTVVRDELTERLAEIDTWEATSRTTDFDA